MRGAGRGLNRLALIGFLGQLAAASSGRGIVAEERNALKSIASATTRDRRPRGGPVHYDAPCPVGCDHKWCAPMRAKLARRTLAEARRIQGGIEHKRRMADLNLRQYVTIGGPELERMTGGRIPDESRP